jgi:SAM-dependent methyltransferase
VTGHAADYYDRYWAADGFRPPPNSNTFLDAQVSRFAASDVRIADLGCGDGRTVGARVQRSGAAYIGVDVSPSAVGAATSLGLDVRLVDDITTTGLPGGSFDAVFMIEVLEHLVDPLAAAREARRLLRPGGTFVVTCPNSAVWTRRVELLLFGRPNAMGDDLSRSEPWRDPHIRSFTLRSLHDLLKCAGFQQVTVGGTEPQVPSSVVGRAAVRLRPTLFARRCTALASG